MSYTRQTGVAVITAVLVLALAATAATTIAANYQLNMRRTENSINSSQAWSYAKGAEQWTMAVLARDLEDNSYDALDEAWWNDGQPLTFPLPGGYIQGQIIDAQGKLNLNKLVEANKVNQTMKERVSRLFFNLEIDPSLVDAVIDWIDSNVEPAGPNGAEQDIYRGLEHAYLPADQPIKDITELRLIHGINQETYDKLLPHVTALPADKTSLNLNTASVQVIACLHPELPDLAAQLVEEREDDPYESAVEFLRHPELQAKGITIDTFDLNVTTNYFNLITTAVIGNSKVKMTSTIYRGGSKNLQVVKRSQNL